MSRALFRCILDGATRLTAALLLAAAFFSAPAAYAKAPEVGASAYALIEGGTRAVLLSGRAHEKLPMASTTKIMTALLALELGNPDELLTVPEEAYGVEGSSIYLQSGERLSLRDLLYGLMLASGNDAAVTIALHIGGSVEGFAELMNQKAAQLGARNTHFVTPNGLPDPAHYTTAYDLALIAAAALEHEEFRAIVGAEYYRAETGSVARTFKNKNKLLWQYQGANGVKTGYTVAAGKCLAFSAERDGMQLVGVVLNCPDMFGEAMRMLDYGFESYALATLVQGGSPIAHIRVSGGNKNSLALAAQRDIMIPVEKSKSAARFRTRVITDACSAPVSAGQVLGKVEVYDGEQYLFSFDLAAAEDVDEASVPFYFEKLIRRYAA